MRWRFKHGQMTKKYLHRIDALRGIAILLVLSYHTLLRLFPGFEVREYADNGVLIINDLQSLILNFNPFGQGWIGVELFLVISGFLIHFIYLQSGSEFKWSSFFSKRFWRIYPPYLLVLLFFVIKRGDLSTSGLIHFLSHLTLVHNLNDNTFFSVNPSFWSIALEVQLYLIYPLYLLLVRYFNSTKTTLLLFSTTVVMCLISYIYDIESAAYGSFVLKFWFTWGAGAFLAEKYYHDRKLFHKPFLWFVLFYVLFFTFKVFDFTSNFILIPATLSCAALMEVVLYSALIDKYAFNRSIFKMLSFVGLISYSVYLIHQPYLDEMISFFNPNTSNWFLNNLVGVGFAYTIIILISFSVYKLVELKSIEYGQLIRNRKLQ